jgi:hypothetical protein
MKASAMETRGITKAATVGIKSWFKRGQLPLSSSMQENKLCILECGSPGTIGGGRCVHKVLEAAQYLALIGGLAKVDGYIHQEEAQDNVVNVQA